ncbi:hypothetical protein PGN35_019900 [Nodosilinea sp. PGN35]|uniref:hypothetical protein n=1 Tax=Nodosilinea sp. PGN35 TaxID=3020489 RepID=UPI0023B2EC11|nr:hypothetical protein [Nodosilinea sp. TSF1-S3]MDF0369755.1 hypothetical protein [Nodosilinea sp. TSF1-S3]
MSLSVGTIDTYSTELDQVQYSNLGTQDSNALALSGSNLWLVDTSSFDDQNTDNLGLEGFTSLYSEGDGYLAPMASTDMASTTGGITMYSSDPNADGILYTGDSSLQTSDSVSLLEVEGQTQGGGSQSSSGSGLSSSTPDEFTLTTSDPITDATTSAGSLALPESGASIGSSDLTGGGTSTQPIFETTGGSSSDLTPAADIKDAPFELHSALGLLAIAAIVVLRRRQGRRPIAVLH